MEAECSPTHREPWDKGKIVGQKAPFKLKDIWALRVRLQMVVRVDAPEGVTLPEVKQAVRQRAAWIWQQLLAVKARRFHVLPREYVSGETHFYLGRRHMLKVLAAEGVEPGVRLWRGRLEITTVRAGALAVRKLLEDWYRHRAADVFAKVFLEMVPRLGLRRTLPPMRLLSMRTQWGRCSPKGEILMTCALIANGISRLLSPLLYGTLADLQLDRLPRQGPC